MFAGEKLTNIRLLYGLSRKQLASELDVTEQSIWQYEHGYISPSLEAINKMLIFFHVQPKYFYTNDNLAYQIREQHIAYRSKVRNSRQKSKSETIYLEFVNHITNYLLINIHYPINKIKEMRNYSVKYKNKYIEHKEINEIIKQIAMYARKQIGLTEENNDDLLFQLEKSGAFIFEKLFGDTVDACSTWSSSDVPFIILGNIKKTHVRRNFDLAHELGHLLLHYKMGITDLNNKEYDQIEKEANLFAAHFLLPEKAFLNDLETVSKVSNPHAYIHLKEKWKVSIAAMAHRAYSLHKMTYQQYRYFNASMNRNNYKLMEPLDEDMIIMKPGKIRNSLQALFEKGNLTVDHLLNYTNFKIELLAGLVSIEESFFEKYLNQNKSGYVYDFIVSEK